MRNWYKRATLIYWLYVSSWTPRMTVDDTTILLMCMRRDSRNATVYHSWSFLKYAKTARRRSKNTGQCPSIIIYRLLLFFMVSMGDEAVLSTRTVTNSSVFSLWGLYHSAVSFQNTQITARIWCPSTRIAQTPFQTTFWPTMNSNTFSGLPSSGFIVF